MEEKGNQIPIQHQMELDEQRYKYNIHFVKISKDEIKSM
jgi:hypothetical protein